MQPRLALAATLLGAAAGVFAACGGSSSGSEAPPTAATLTWTVAPSALAFGVVAPGATKDLGVTIRNTSTTVAGVLVSADLPPGGFSVVGNPFPLSISAGTAAQVTLRYAPSDGLADAGTVTFHETGVGPDVLLPVSGSPPATEVTEVVTDYGMQFLTSGTTPTLSVTVPEDAISLSLEAEMPGALIGLSTWTGPGGRVYENASSTGAYVWGPGLDVALFGIPNTDRADVQLVPGGGTYTFSLRRLSGFGGTMNVRAIVERRGAPVQSLGRLDLNVWLANAITPKASTAAADARLQAVLARIGTILQQQGITLGDVDYYDVTDPVFDRVTESEFPNLLQLTGAAAEERLNLFFVVEAIGGGVVGVSPTVGGPKVNGTTASGVMSVYDGLSTALIGLIAAHELGHYLGLQHTAEQSGQHDDISDTANCPASGTDLTCPTEGGGYLMHWMAVGGTDVTNGQGRVLRGHPHLDAPAAGVPLQLPGLAKPAEAITAPEDAELLGHGWCGTCCAAQKSATAEKQIGR